MERVATSSIFVGLSDAAAPIAAVRSGSALSQHVLASPHHPLSLPRHVWSCESP